MKTTFEAIKVNQPIGDFYVCKVLAKELIEMAKVDIMRISSDGDCLYEGIQRKIIPKKVKKIKEYLLYSNATFPNTIIVNVDKSNFIDFDGKFLTLEKKEDIFTIIDGQHRIEGLKECDKNQFELAVSIFIGLSVEEQSRIFVTINTQQTKIDPSHSLYHELQNSYYSPRKMVVKIAEMFFIDRSSPWHKKIKMLGRRDELSEEGILSLIAFAEPIIEKIYDDSQYYLLNNLLENRESDFSEIKKNYFWDFYIEKNEKIVYKILFNYFSAFKIIFRNDWGNSRSLLTKTTGYNAMMMLFDDLYDIGVKKHDLTMDFFIEILEPLRKLDGSINSSEFGASGISSSRNLYLRLKRDLKL